VNASSLRKIYRYLPKDFVLSKSGLLCALVGWGVEDGRLLVTPRYLTDASDGVERNQKLAGQHVGAIVDELVPHWRIDCPRRNTRLIAMPIVEVAQHLKPEATVQKYVQSSDGNKSTVGNSLPEAGVGDLTSLLERLLELGFQGSLGVTGSMLVGCSNAQSDFDITIYGTDHFRSLQALVAQKLSEAVEFRCLDDQHWRATHQRRAGKLSFDDYVWHEKRKFNKFLWRGRRIDLSCIDSPPSSFNAASEKLGNQEITATVIDDSRSSCYGSVYGIDDESVFEIVSYSPSFCCQAVVGETVRAAGCVEQTRDGRRRLVVGTGHDARGEFIQVLRGKQA
jgi:hypothetical protein